MFKPMLIAINLLVFIYYYISHLIPYVGLNYHISSCRASENFVASSSLFNLVNLCLLRKHNCLLAAKFEYDIKSSDSIFVWKLFSIRVIGFAT